MPPSSSNLRSPPHFTPYPASHPTSQKGPVLQSPAWRKTLKSSTMLPPSPWQQQRRARAFQNSFSQTSFRGRPWGNPIGCFGSIIRGFRRRSACLCKLASWEDQHMLWFGCWSPLGFLTTLTSKIGITKTGTKPARKLMLVYVSIKSDLIACSLLFSERFTDSLHGLAALKRWYEIKIPYMMI